MQPLNGPGVPIANDRNVAPTKLPSAGQVEERALTPAQRTTLEKLIVRIMALSPIKSAEIWAGLRHDLSLSSTSDLLARHFQPAEQLLQTRLSQAQENHANHQLRQQLTELLPQGNNRQAVSDFIRQQFGHTVLSQLSHAELQQVLVLLQSGTLNIPQPQLTTVTDRPLLPAEHQHIQSLVAKLSAATGEQPAKIWQALFDMVGVKSNDPLPARHFQILSQFLQVKVALSQQTAPTLINLQTALKQPADAQEQQLLIDYSQNRFQASPTTPLTQAQLNDIINVLFAARLDRANAAQRLAEDQKTLQPLINPLIAALPQSLQPLLQKPSLAFVALIIVMAFLLAIFL
ncbi:TPA: flagella biosynthesis regulator Flk [Yersinia enterocolitica]|uniref:flagella biosynthesis regulator Flk n=1 Tax=Yersinia enterocolitica TaxID=630 RepID=UPI0021E7F9D8|nr:flagella biosynthesis regulator Flk [Yersinia enterocolitica]UYJ83888.1 flagella biosynthesis regulator Flk [Yersinia enterocolitica]UYK13267.1 flagella biosynthesis regulator Flk [Yersinia enterocolitica]HDL7925810.1 flagella biosynthesis regulator Flk [Yersinia enterocolitica]HDY4893656.1 flagella biosynthesis regulator Flk [Yersinia enterocolitica]HEN3467143.1 flagella biosynthesis regulator Flk [Yersinia enterocolitica]